MHRTRFLAFAVGAFLLPLGPAAAEPAPGPAPVAEGDPALPTAPSTALATAPSTAPVVAAPSTAPLPAIPAIPVIREMPFFPAVAADASGEDHWLVSLSALLVDRYRVAGELRLSWHRPLPASAPRVADLELIQAPAVLAPQILVQVRARAGAGQPTEHTLLLRAELWREGYTVRQPAAVGAPVLLAVLEPRPVDLLRERDAFTLDLAAPEAGSDAAPELDFARAVPAGRVLVWRDVLRRPLVRRGQPVDVVASDGALSVSLRAVALHDAARGESVRVRNPDSKREFVATVTAESRASVRF